MVEEDVSVYATKYKECRICGTGADCTYTSNDHAATISEKYCDHCSRRPRQDDPGRCHAAPHEGGAPRRYK